MRLQSDSVDFLFGDDQQHFVSAFLQCLRYSEAGKEMPACAPAGNDNTERLHSLQEFRTRRRTGDATSMSGFPNRWILTRTPIMK